MDYEQFENEMKSKYPKMFSQPFGGFAIGKGWYPIIDSLCRQIQHHVEWKQEQKEKYRRGSGCEQVVVLQIKEKFGGLRFYYRGGDDVVDGMVRMAESWAGHSCEECGNVGKHRGGGWIRTLCDLHDIKRQEKMKED